MPTDLIKTNKLYELSKTILYRQGPWPNSGARTMRRCRKADVKIQYARKAVRYVCYILMNIIHSIHTSRFGIRLSRFGRHCYL